MISSDNYRNENELINIIIGLTYPRASFPHPLYDFGYEVKAIEKSFVNSSGGTVKPDLIIANEKSGYLITFEAKSGKNAEENQLENYAAVTDNDLKVNAGFSDKSINNGYDISYICYNKTFVKGTRTSGFNNLIKSIKKKYYFPVLVFNRNNSQLSLEYHKFKDKQLNELFENIVVIPLNRMPEFIKFDQHSDTEEIKMEVIRSIINYIYDGKFSFTIQEMLNEIISPFPGFSDLIGAKTKKSIMGKLKRVLKGLGNEKPDYLEWVHGEWKINKKLSELHYSQLQALFNLAGKGDITKGQLGLFDNMDLE